ncbi:hypothetical protein [Sphingobium cupriresistens]|uniref:hypothetical protein n=1 Tax=Sphingobium cupriresistens TaxID=1132417 RepID=UPI003BF4D0B6
MNIERFLLPGICRLVRVRADNLSGIRQKMRRISACLRAVVPGVISNCWFNKRCAYGGELATIVSMFSDLYFKTTKSKNQRLPEDRQLSLRRGAA